MRGGRWLVAVAAGAVVLGGAACQGARPAAQETPDGSQLHVSLERPRYLVVAHKVEIILRNEGAGPVTIDSLQLRSGWFSAVAPTLRRFVVEPGERVDVPVGYGQARCDTDVEQHEVLLGVDGGEPQPWVLQDADAAISLLHDEECHRQAVEAAADIGFGTAFRQVDDRTVRATLVVQRAESTERVTVDEIRGGVIWSLKTVDGDTPALDLSPGQQRATTEVELGITRCDAHGLAESKKTYRFPVYVSLGDTESQYLEVEPKGDGLALLEQMLDRCANG